jgi:hypothetical protein
MQGYEIAFAEGLRGIGALAFVAFVAGILVAALWGKRK